jgi:hypothetical protein
MSIQCCTSAAAAVVAVAERAVEVFRAAKVKVDKEVPLDRTIELRLLPAAHHCCRRDCSSLPLGRTDCHLPTPSFPHLSLTLSLFSDSEDSTPPRLHLDASHSGTDSAASEILSQHSVAVEAVERLLDSCSKFQISKEVDSVLQRFDLEILARSGDSAGFAYVVREE